MVRFPAPRPAIPHFPASTGSISKLVTEFGELADTPYAVSDAIHSRTPLTRPCMAMQKSLFTFVVTGCCRDAGMLTPSFTNVRKNFASALSMTSSFVIGCK
jgi:hypothetical protein